MADSDPNDVPFAEFIDDYFVECDEHLSVARNNLLALEQAALPRYVGSAEQDRALLDELFRGFHSVKGLSAMVGVRKAEAVAHHLESYLSLLRKGQVQLTAEGVEVLITGVKTLEQVIAARRGQTIEPEIDLILTEVAALLEGMKDEETGKKEDASPTSVPPLTSLLANLPPEKSRLLAAALASGSRAWRCAFVPSPALAERGVNVNTVRKRLQEMGELLHAVPLVNPGGQIAFAFLVVSRADETSFASLKEDGVTFVPEVAYPPGSNEGEGSREEKKPSSFISPPSSLMPSNVVRVDLTRLDDLMRLVGELVINRSRLEENLKLLTAVLPLTYAPTVGRALQETSHAFERQLRDLREGVMRLRLVPVRDVFARMQFVVRDLTRESGKEIRLEARGEETEIDKYVVERIMDPLLHLVRNAVSHGLELPQERAAKGKPPMGSLSLRASASGETILIEVEDDGRGIDAEAVVARARGMGVAGTEAGSDGVPLLDLICAPGFSTREEADRASGRGMGMAVVRTVVEELGGFLSLDTRVGRGTHFTLQLPLTLAIADALLVIVSGQTFAVPQVLVREVLQVETDALRHLENHELIPYRDGVLTLVRLGAFFGLVDVEKRTLNVLVVGMGRAAVGIAVDRVVGLREIVVRPLNDPLLRVPGIGGATELGDGRVVLILDPIPLARAAHKRSLRSKIPNPKSQIPKKTQSLGFGIWDLGFSCRDLGGVC